MENSGNFSIPSGNQTSITHWEAECDTPAENGLQYILATIFKFFGLNNYKLAVVALHLSLKLYLISFEAWGANSIETKK